MALLLPLHWPTDPAAGLRENSSLALLPTAPQVVRSIRQAKQPVRHPIHSTRPPTSNNHVPLVKQSPIQPPRLEDGVYPKRSHSTFHSFLTRGAMACLSA